MLISLLFLSLNLSSLFRFSIARGAALHSYNYSGYIEGINGRSGRRLHSDGTYQMSEQEYIERLENLAQGYMSNTDLEKAMKELNSRCSNISRIYSIGKSVNEVPLWAIEISDMPGEMEAEPAFKFIGNVHGDEPVGRELLLLLANWLCDNYMKDSLATLIVDHVHLHILPSMNPDGFSLRRRNNANNIDLNRDFPDQHLNSTMLQHLDKIKHNMDTLSLTRGLSPPGHWAPHLSGRPRFDSLWERIWSYRSYKVD